MRLSQVMLNLDNAGKFTKRGSITITTEIKSDSVQVTVKDIGTGIHPEIYPKLFSKFATKSHRGTGLGLFISKSIVEAHSGKIWAESSSQQKELLLSLQSHFQIKRILTKKMATMNRRNE